MIYNEDLTFKDPDDHFKYNEMIEQVIPILRVYLKNHFSNTEADLWITQRMLESDIGLLVSDIFMDMQNLGDKA